MKYILLIVVCLSLFSIIKTHKRPKHNLSDVIDPSVLKPHMFTQTITGFLDKFIPHRQHMNLKGQVVSEQYNIEMVKTTKQFLPPSLFNKTTIYAYGGQTNTGYKAGYPGPMILATKNTPITVTWKNSIKGPHILPVDYNYPFKSTDAFKNEVPTVPHAHGVATNSSSDGQPQAYWTSSGSKGPFYKSQIPAAINQAVFKYPNQQDAGNNWYHDHTIGMTRLNVYAGLAGFYKIADPNTTHHKKQKYLQNKYGNDVNESQTRFLIISDKSFKTNGELYYPSSSQNPQFSSWVPQFYGNTMLVNGVIWPKMNLKKGKYRFVLLNACQNRFLNIWFENNNKKLPFELIRIDEDYYDKQIVVSQFFATIANRIEFILDLSLVSGQIILKNNAAAPYPQGDPVNLIPQFTGQIMKIVMQNNQQSLDQQELIFDDIQTKVNLQTNDIIEPQIVYPTFPQGQKVFSTLFQVHNQNDDVNGMFIDGTSMMMGMNCTNSTYKMGNVYDFYIINLTPDTHPIHFHLINMQKVKQFKFDVQKYTEKYFQINGGQPDKHGFKHIPISLDPEEFRTDEDEQPKEYQKIFKDTFDAQPQYVTVLRIKFSKNDGSNWKSMNVKGQRYVWHCHMLQHQDNQMMKYFCLQ